MKNKRYSIVDLILMDHRFLKEATQLLSDDESDPIDKLSMARNFFNRLKMHCAAKARTLYSDLRNEEEFQQEILDAQARHHRIAERLRTLGSEITDIHWITKELSLELKELAESVRQLLDLEEKHLLPLMRQHLSELYLCDLGIRFEKIRKFTTQELETLPNVPTNVSRKVEAHLNHP